MTIDYDKIRRNAAKIGRDALIYQHGIAIEWKQVQVATDAAISFYNASIEDVSALLEHPDEIAQLRAERVQLQGENESLRADLDLAHGRLDQQKKNDHYLDQRIDALEKRVTYVADTLGQRIAELVETTGGTIPGYEPEQRPPLTPEQRDTFGRGDEVRLDMAQSMGGRRLFGWYTVVGIGTAVHDAFTVQVAAPEKADPQPLFWIKAEDVLEVRKAAR